MKKIIKIINPNQNTKMINWSLHNTCNYKCNFCPPHYNSGSERWLSTDIYLKTIDNIHKQATAENKKLYFQLSGGEPTLIPDFIEIANHVKLLGHYYGLNSNGTRTLRWWERLKNECPPDILILTHHKHQGSQKEHHSQISELFSSVETNVYINITSPPDIFTEALEDFHWLIENSISVCTLKGILNKTGMLLDSYNNYQREQILKNTFITSKKKKITASNNNYCANFYFDDNSISQDNSFLYLHKDQVNFTGWECSIGQNYINISHTKVFRGTCHQDGIIADILKDENLFAKDTTICTKKACLCPPEIMQDKWEKS